MWAISGVIFFLSLVLAKEEWSTKVQMEHEASLNCSDNKISGNIQTAHWLFSRNAKIFPPNFTEEYFAVRAGIGMIFTNADGMILTITKVLEQHFGVYFCVVTFEDQSVLAIKRGINVDGPDWGDRWKVYRKSVMIGGIAVAVFLVLSIVLTLAYIYRPQRLRNVVSTEPVPGIELTSRIVEIKTVVDEPVGNTNVAFIEASDVDKKQVKDVEKVATGSGEPSTGVEKI